MTISPNFAAADYAAALPTHEADALCDGGNLAQILHNGMVYTLRITRAGKLILTK